MHMIGIVEDGGYNMMLWMHHSRLLNDDEMWIFIMVARASSNQKGVEAI